MQASQLRPAGTLAQKFGVKALAYGGPGTGKTPLVNTAPRPVLLVCEPGMLSMRGSTVPAWEAYTVAQLIEFAKWVFQSHEAKNFDTIAIDSLSQLAELILADSLGRKKDGRAAYGEMSRAVMEHFVAPLYFMQNKHIFMIAKQSKNDQNYCKPYFPGQDLNVKIPHLFDEIWQIGLHSIPGVVGPQRAIRTLESFDAMARDRTGKLAEFEPPNLATVFAKAMS